MNQKKEGYTPIQPYDITLGENYRIYDKTTYTQDKDLCGGKDSIRLSSGNVCKYYNAKICDCYKLGDES